MQRSLPLRLDRISKSFGAVQALSPVSLEIEPGEMMALLGPSGCGKTTTLRIVAGFSMPDTGSVLIGDRDVTELPPNKRELGMVFQNYSLFPHMSVSENIAFGLKMRKVGSSEISARVSDILHLVRLQQYGDRSIHQLSGGQQQRVSLARALITNPSTLLLDEPLGALDRNLRESMQFELREIQKKLGITAILVTHDQEEALTMSDRIAVMSTGKIVQIGTPVEVYERPASPFISKFLGTMNILAGKVLGEGEGGRTAIRLDATQTVIEINADDAAQNNVKVAIRPERMSIHSDGTGDIPAHVRAVVYRGSYYAYELKVLGVTEPLYVYSKCLAEVGPDGLVSLGFDRDYAILLDAEAT